MESAVQTIISSSQNCALPSANLCFYKQNFWLFQLLCYGHYLFPHPSFAPSLSLYIYIYIYTEREREIEKERENYVVIDLCVSLSLSLFFSLPLCLCLSLFFINTFYVYIYSSLCICSFDPSINLCIIVGASIYMNDSNSYFSNLLSLFLSLSYR